jgi:hypothetical protein
MRRLLAASCLSALVGCGITAPTGNSGYADLDSLGFRDVDRTLSLSLGPSVLRFAATHIEDDPQARALVGQLDGVRVFTYDVVGDADRVGKRIDRMSRKLQGRGWVPVILVQEPGARTVMLIKTREDHIAGLTLLTSDTHEAVVVNVMGELHPDMFSGTMAALDVDLPLVQLAEAP